MRRRELIFSLPGIAWAAKPVLAPSFEFFSTSGQQESVAKYRGKTVALYFFNPG